MTRRFALLGSALALIALTACGGGGGGNSPTQPNPTLLLTLTLSNTSGDATFRQLDLFIDDVRLGTATVSQGSASSPTMHADAGAQARGRHVIRAQVNDQSVSPSTYVLTGTAEYDNRTIPVNSAPTSVATGGSLSVELAL